MLLSICIPTYNRGMRAKMLVKNLLSLPYDENEIEIVVSDNGSSKYSDKYAEIADINDARLHYYRADHNMGFMKNVNQVMRLSKGDYCMLISDEDRIAKENLDIYMDILRQHDDLAVVKAKNSIQYTEDHDISAAKGHEALDNYYMKGNYISGAIYNRHILTNEVIDEYEKKYSQNIAYIHYTHMFYDAYMTLNGRFIYKDLLLIMNCKPEGDIEEITSESGIESYGAYQSRIDQMMGFIEQVKDVNVDAGLKLHMFQKICDKYVYLVWLVYHCNKDSEEVLKDILEVLRNKMREGFEYIGIPLQEEDKKEVYSFIDSLMDFGRFIDYIV